MKKVLNEHPFKHLLRWAASPETFTMDFGAYEEDYVVVVTNEGEAISNLISGYIDLLLKKTRGIDSKGMDSTTSQILVSSLTMPKPKLPRQ
jgi:talin